jgi:uncharacterized membrane protein
MLPNPVHPAVVHFPIVLMILLPIAAAVALAAIRRGVRLRMAWAVPVAFSAALAASAWLALETGEDQEDKVEQIVPRTALETHAGAAEAFLIASAVLFVVTAAGLAGGPIGRTARWTSTLGALVVVAMGVRVGDAGGKLVYQHGAAMAYTTGSGPQPSTPAGSREGERGESP